MWKVKVDITAYIVPDGVPQSIQYSNPKFTKQYTFVENAEERIDALTDIAGFIDRSVPEIANSYDLRQLVNSNTLRLESVSSKYTPYIFNIAIRILQAKSNTRGTFKAHDGWFFDTQAKVIEFNQNCRDCFTGYDAFSGTCQKCLLRKECKKNRQ